MYQTAVEGLICFATGGVCVLMGIVVDGGGHCRASMRTDDILLTSRQRQKKYTQR